MVVLTAINRLKRSFKYNDTYVVHHSHPGMNKYYQISSYESRWGGVGRRDVGSQATCSILIICLLVQNCINIVLKGA